MRPISRMVVSPDVGDLSQEARRLFDELVRRRGDRRFVMAGECQPGLDVLETEQAIEIVLDVPGVRADDLRLIVKSGVVLIVGEKERADAVRGPASYHLVERDFGRFARAVRINTAVDAARAHARLKDGELRVLLPKTVERRGRELAIAVDEDRELPAARE